MTEFDRVGSSDTFFLRVVPLFMQVCEKRSQARREKDDMFARRWFCYCKSLGVRLPVCPVNKNILTHLPPWSNPNIFFNAYVNQPLQGIFTKVYIFLQCL